MRFGFLVSEFCVDGIEELQDGLVVGIIARYEFSDSDELSLQMIWVHCFSELLVFSFSDLEIIYVAFAMKCFSL